MANDPSPEAAIAWEERATLADFGSRLRGPDASWGCDFAHRVVSLGSVGFFNRNDVPPVVDEAKGEGAKSDRIAAMLHDVLKLRYRDVVAATVALCGPLRS